MRIQRVDNGEFFVEDEGVSYGFKTVDELFEYLTNLFRGEVKVIENKIKEEGKNEDRSK